MSVEPLPTSAPLLEALAATSERTLWRGCVPGHKGGSCVDHAARELLGHSFPLDFPTEILGIDKGLDYTSPFSHARRLLAGAYGARSAWFLTQGATQGVLASMLVLSRRCQRVMVQRGSHFSVFSGLALSGLEADFIAEAVDEDFGVPMPL